MNRSERVLVAFKLLMEAERPVTARELAAVTGTPPKQCGVDLAMLGRLVPLDRVESGPRVGWALPGRGIRSRARLAYEARAEGRTWAAAARRAGYATASVARTMAQRYATRSSLVWPCRGPSNAPSDRPGVDQVRRNG